MSIIDQLLALFVPHRCLGCGEEGALVCRACADSFEPPAACCVRCQRPSAHSSTCDACRPLTALTAATAATAYSGLSRDLLWRLKSAGAQAAAREMANFMAVATEVNCDYIVPVPTTSSRVRERGYDQAKLLAREISRRTHLPYLDCLVRAGRAHQVGAGREQRLRQLSGAFHVQKASRVAGARLLLVDDVLTTGATLCAAAEALQRAGAARIEAITFARAQRQFLHKT